MNENTAVTVQQKPSLVTKIASKYGVDANKMLATLKDTAFKTQGEITNEQMMALLIVADQYGLNPFTKELFAFPDKRAGIIPVVSVDGWARIINGNPAYDGVEFIDGPAGPNNIPEWIECVIYRKDRGHPTKVRERFQEVRRETQPWISHPTRMMRHKVFIQCARLAFGFGGIYDEDEADRIRKEIDVTPLDSVPEATEPPKKTKTAAVVDRLKKVPTEAPKGVVVDAETGEVVGAQAEPEQPPPEEAAPDDESPKQPAPAITFENAKKVIAKTKFQDIAAETLDLASKCLSEAEVNELATILDKRLQAGELE